MSYISHSELIKALNWRYAVKKFDATKKIPTQDWSTLTQAITLTASSYGLQPWKFIDVRNPEVRKQLTPYAYNQTQVQDASHFLVLTHLRHVEERHIEKFVKFTAQLRGVPVESTAAYAKVMIGDLVNGPRAKVIEQWASRQVYIAMGNALTSAALLGIDSCPMEGLDPAGFDKVLNLESSEYKTVAAIAFGYRSEQDGFSKFKKSRYDVSEVVTQI